MRELRIMTVITMDDDGNGEDIMYYAGYNMFTS